MGALKSIVLASAKAAWLNAWDVNLHIVVNVLPSSTLKSNIASGAGPDSEYNGVDDGRS